MDDVSGHTFQNVKTGVEIWQYHDLIKSCICEVRKPFDNLISSPYHAGCIQNFGCEEFFFFFNSFHGAAGRSLGSVSFRDSRRLFFISVTAPLAAQITMKMMIINNKLNLIMMKVKLYFKKVLKLIIPQIQKNYQKKRMLTKLMLF